VAESAVVSYPHDIFGEGVYAYITLKENVNEDESALIGELKALVKSKIAHYAIPHCFLVRKSFMNKIKLILINSS
jgi:acetyl-CoA synthetase